MGKKKHKNSGNGKSISMDERKESNQMSSNQTNENRNGNHETDGEANEINQASDIPSVNAIGIDNQSDHISPDHNHIALYEVTEDGSNLRTVYEHPTFQKKENNGELAEKALTAIVRDSSDLTEKELTQKIRTINEIENKVISQVEQTKTEEIKTEEIKKEETKTEKIKTEKIKTEETKTEETKTEEIKTEEIKTDAIITEAADPVLNKHGVNFNQYFSKIAKYFRNRNEVPRRNFILPLLFFIGTFIYLEVVVHLLLYKSIDFKIIYPILFAIPAGTLCTVLTGFFHRMINKIIIWVITGFACLVFNVQLIYFSVFKVFFTFQSLGMAGDAFSEFGSDVVTAIKGNIFGMILLYVPLVGLAILMSRFYDWDKRDMKGQGLLFLGTVLLHSLVLGTLFFFGRGDFTPYDLYHKSQIHDLCGEQLGIMTMTRLDIANLWNDDSELVLAETDIIEWEEDVTVTLAPTKIPELTPAVVLTPIPVEPDASPTPTPLPTPTPIDTSPNILEIDFSALAEKEEDATIRKLHQYFASVTPTNKNEYTGMFEGYNLILITAEGFSPYAVVKEKTPTLYRLINEGFVFKNFYTALWQTSTSDGEYVPLTGLIPIGTRSMYHSRNDLLPFTLAHQFNRLGIHSRAYHNHTYTYYKRDLTHPNLGYDYKGVGNGLELEHNVWPNSDLELINATVDEYIGEEQFHVYYLTVSGHMNYTFIGNSMSYKNRALVADLPYSDDIKAYIACQMELDKALEQLIKKLEEAGVADKTVIALSADHYPYGWEKDNIDTIAGHEVDTNFEIFKNHFVLWNPAMEESIVVEEPCSSLDILPTLSNLFGLEYDSRLLMGRDIFSDAEPLVILSNRSFITDKVMYNSANRETTLLTDAELPEDYISNLNKIIKNKFSVSESIIKKDYYRYVFPDMAE
ncbi:MAG: hypothetical protein K0S76_1600 [Herbinix sp.]|jgi:phosphoglycerol transferase MdoB-like AlkP superfamily enzyme|nr:hypothetical protein [Herbinix sp.]